jgi:hypothetical protein
MNHPYSSAASCVYVNDVRPTYAQLMHGGLTYPVAQADPPPKYTSPYPIPTSAPPPGSRSSIHKPPIPSPANLRTDIPRSFSQGPWQFRPLPPLPHEARVHPYPYEKHPVAAEEFVSEWVDDDTDDGMEDLQDSEASKETVSQTNDSRQNFASTSVITRYAAAGEDVALVPRRNPATLLRPSQSMLEARKHAAWRQKIIDIMCV